VLLYDYHFPFPNGFIRQVSDVSVFGLSGIVNKALTSQKGKDSPCDLINGRRFRVKRPGF
jgi:hypothetical protein